MTKAQLVEVIVKAMPHPDQISAWDLDGEDQAVRFSWRGVRFRVSNSLFCETVEGAMLSGGNVAILCDALLRRTAYELRKETPQSADTVPQQQGE